MTPAEAIAELTRLWTLAGEPAACMALRMGTLALAITTASELERQRDLEEARQELGRLRQQLAVARTEGRID